MSTPPPPPSGDPAPQSGGAPTQIAGQETGPRSTVPYTPDLPAYAPSREHTNTMAIISLVTGLVAFFGHIVLPGIGGGTLAVVAIVTGLIARSEIKRTGEQGRGLATVGIILGIVHLALIALLIVLLIVGVFAFGTWALLHR